MNTVAVNTKTLVGVCGMACHVCRYNISGECACLADNCPEDNKLAAHHKPELVVVIQRFGDRKSPDRQLQTKPKRLLFLIDTVNIVLAAQHVQVLAE